MNHCNEHRYFLVDLVQVKKILPICMEVIIGKYVKISEKEKGKEPIQASDRL